MQPILKSNNQLSEIATVALLLLTLPPRIRQDFEPADLHKELADFLLQYKDEHITASTHIGEHFLIASALTCHAPHYMDGLALGRTIAALTKIEQQPGGPYGSNMLPSRESSNPDIGVNAIIGLFLSLHDVSLEPLTTFIEKAIITKNYRSAYYSEPFTLYCIASWYRGNHTSELITHLLAHQQSVLDNPLSAALLMNALYQLTVDRAAYETLVNYLANHVQTAVFDSKHEQALVRALYLQVAKPKNKLELAAVDAKAGEDRMMERILSLAQQRFSTLNEEMRVIALKQITKTIHGNPDRQMSLMPYFVREALGRKGTQFSDDFIAELGLMNIFFWTAFIIYDDFWDEDEAARPHILPTANLFAREFTQFFNTLLPKESGFADFFRTLMDKLDAANTWETLHCRTPVHSSQFTIPANLPDFDEYTRKYEPASAHILGPVVMLYHLGYTLDSPEVSAFIDYCKHYLIAMQLNDDMHDWEEDLSRGNLSTVVDLLLRDLAPGRESIDLKDTKEVLQKLFWFTTLPKACSKATVHTTLSRQALARLTIFENITPLEQFIRKNERAVNKALQEQRTSAEFIRSFTMPSE